MTPARVQNLLIYCLVAAANILAIALAAALASGTMPGFRDGEMLAPAKAEMAALLAFVVPILSGLVAANRPSFGGEGLAAQASVYREQGVHRDDMVVLPRDQAVQVIADPPLTVSAVADELERRRDERVKARLRGSEAAPGVPSAERG